MLVDRRQGVIYAAIGVPEIPAVIGDIASWRATVEVAKRYQDGRVFLAGPAKLVSRSAPVAPMRVEITHGDRT